MCVGCSCALLLNAPPFVSALRDDIDKGDRGLREVCDEWEVGHVFHTFLILQHL